MVTSFTDLAPGTPLPPLTLEISAAANDRYWDGAAVEHPLRREGALYPLIAANLTVLAFGGLCADPVIQARQRLVCHRRADAPATLHTTGEVTERYERRGRRYVVIDATGRGSTTASGSGRRASSSRRRRRCEPTRDAARSLVITEDLIRRYSRRGNYHSEASTASELGLPGLVAQGTQVTGPAFGLLLDAWGEDFLAHGSLDVKFVGVTLAGDHVVATVTIDGDDGAAAATETTARHDGEPHADATLGTATIEVRNDTRGATAVVGDARRC